MCDTAAPERIGIMGGTFDPVHNGHIVMAESASEQLQLDRVLFIPTGNPNFKQGQQVTPAQDRVEMLKLALQDKPHFELDLREVERPGVTYSADTLEELHEEFPGAELYFLMGVDSAQTIVHWRRAERVAELCKVVAVQRPGYSFDSIDRAMEQSDIDFELICLEIDAVDVSSTEVRRRISCGETVQGLVPDAVIEYIVEHGLYGCPQER